MGQTLVNNYVHLVFSTYKREPFLDSEIRPEVFRYIGGLIHAANSHCIEVGGYTDHIHILFLLSKKHTLVETVKKIKGNSSRWIKIRWPHKKDFAWQAGYGAFSVGKRGVDSVIKYIKNQEAYHLQQSYQKEYLHLLAESGIEFNERQLWT